LTKRLERAAQRRQGDVVASILELALHFARWTGSSGPPSRPCSPEPRFESRMALHISPVRIQRIKERWEREVLYGLARRERRLDRTRQALAHTLLPRRHYRDNRRSEQLLPFKAAPRRDGQLELFTTARRSLRLARGNGAARSGYCSAGLLDGGNRIPSEPCGALCSVWRRGPCPSRCETSFGCHALCEGLACGNGRAVQLRGARDAIPSPWTRK
jgi:hypothetical protein